jgi:hypothetical protein
MKINILYVHYFTLLFIVLALFLSFIVMIYSVKNSKLQYFNTWQFPMLLALFLDGIITIK